MAAGKLLSVGQFTLLKNSLKCFNVLIRDFGKKDMLQRMGVPPKPKKPASSFILFQVTERNELSVKYPEKSFGEISKILGAKWKSMSDDEKSKYKATFSEKFADYKSQLEDYLRRYGDLDKKEIQKLQTTIGSFKMGKKEIRELEKQYKKPECPNNPYKLFVQENMAKWDLPAVERIQKCAELWRNMPEREKQNYIKMHQKKYEQYQKELDKWEEDMIKQGKVELVRPETLKGKFKNK